MNFGLSILVAFAVVIALVVWIPVIPYVFGMLVACIDGLVYPLYYLGASCSLINNFSSYIMIFISFWLLIKLYKQFLV